jgi:hypothetical protein
VRIRHQRLYHHSKVVKIEGRRNTTDGVRGDGKVTAVGGGGGKGT